MMSPNEFWLRFHEAAEAFRDEGQTPQERTDATIKVFYSMPPAARRQLLADAGLLAGQMTELYTLMCAAEQELDFRPQGRRTG